MMRIDGEPEAGPCLLREPVEERVGNLDQLPAVLAHEVTVHRGGQVICRWAMPEMGVHDDTEALQLVEVAVDGREVDVGGLGLHFAGELLGRPVAFRGKQRAQQEAT